MTKPDPLLDRLMEEATLTYTIHAGKKTAFRSWGEGEPIVLLHGGSGSWRHWVRNIIPFSQSHRVIAPDLPGFGLSDEPDYPAEIEVMGAAVSAGLDELIGTNTAYNLVCFSYGGSIASQLLQYHPNRQRTLTLCAAAGLAETRVPQMMSLKGKTGGELVDAHRTNLLRVMIGQPENIDPLAMRVQHESTFEARLKVRTLKRGKWLAETLEGFNGRVEAFWGELDTFLYEGALQIRMSTLKRLQPDAEITVLPGIGHWLAYEAADIFNGIAMEFINRK
ncbi:alpha/beta hydrolase [Corticibacterium sp. UT-5YL-CI-8]|nr:alpha/beta hydrolase [Tianweitania sp. UT-5YL-CI-8]